MKTALLLDSDPASRRLSAAALRALGWQALEAPEGADLVEVARSAGADLVLLHPLDLAEDPFALCRRLRDDPVLGGRCQVAFLGPVHSDEFRARALQAGARGVVPRPLSPMDVLEGLRLYERRRDRVAPGRPQASTGSFPAAAPQLPASAEASRLMRYADEVVQAYREERQKGDRLRSTGDALREGERMRDRYLALLSPPLARSLTGLQASLSLLEQAVQKVQPDGELARLLGSMREEAASMDRLLADLQGFVKSRVGEAGGGFRELLPALLVHQVTRALDPEIRARNLHLQVEVEGDVPPLCADPGLLREALVQLLRNALTFTDPGGRLRVRLADSREGICLEVEDTGIGIAAEDLERITAAGYCGSGVAGLSGRRLGLGLALVRRAAEEHGGRLEVESVPGRGSCFRLVIPRRESDTWRLVEELAGPGEDPVRRLSQHLEAAEEGLVDYVRDLFSRYQAERERVAELEEARRELEQTFLEVIRAMARVVDARDAYRGSHSDRVAHYATAVARRLDPDLVHRRDFLYSLILHDIGKIGVAEDILQKVGSLSEEEIRRLRSHTEIGVELLAPLRFLTPAISGVRHHHERWDGKGYPDGLKGEEIPLPARIIAVADAFDAMTSDRPYRPSMPFEQARAEVERQAGKQFDPAVVRAFLEAWDDLVAYRESLASGAGE